MGCDQRLLLLVCCLLVTGSHALFDQPPDITMEPRDPVVQEGDTLQLTCTIQPTYNGSYTYTDLQFVLLGTPHPLTAYSNITTITYQSPLTAVLTVHNITHLQSGHYRCSLPDRPRVLRATQDVRVYRRPVQPTVTSCVLYDYETVSCSWQPSDEFQRNFTFAVAAFQQIVQCRQSSSPIWTNCTCSKQDGDSCEWTMDPLTSLTGDTLTYNTHSSYCVRVVTWNIPGKQVMSPEHCVQLSDIVKLAKPLDLKVELNNRTHAAISWTVPAVTEHPDTPVVYNVTVYSQWHQQKAVFESHVEHMTSAVTTVPFTVEPFTRYAVSVVVRPVESVYWSEAATYNLTTQSDIPRRSPLMSVNSFTVQRAQQTSIVSLYWQLIQPSDCHSAKCYYRVVQRASGEPTAANWQLIGDRVPADMSTVSLTFNETVTSLDLSVVTENELGRSQPATYAHIPGALQYHTVSLVSELMVEGNETATSCHWTTNMAAADQSKMAVESYSLFWCLRPESTSDSDTCQGDINWVDFPNVITDFNLSLQHNYRQYNYGLATVLATDDGTGSGTDSGTISGTGSASGSRMLSSGIVWINCLYSLTGPVSAPRITKVTSVKSGELSVTWSHLPCIQGQGYINAFQLYYCRLTEENLCIAGSTSHVVVDRHLTRWTLKSLETGVIYSVWIRSQTRNNKLSVESNKLTAVTITTELTTAAIVGISVVGIVFVLLLIVVVCTGCRKCRRWCNKFTNLSIKVPVSENSSLQSPVSSNRSDAPILEYSRITYSRQCSRLSSSSRDSGHFCLSISPLSNSPDKPSVLLPLMCDESTDGYVGRLAAPSSGGSNGSGSYVGQLALGNNIASYVNGDVRTTGYHSNGSCSHGNTDSDRHGNGLLHSYAMVALPGSQPQIVCHDANDNPQPGLNPWIEGVKGDSLLQVDRSPLQTTPWVEGRNMLEVERPFVAVNDGGYVRHGEWVNRLAV